MVYDDIIDIFSCVFVLRFLYAVYSDTVLSALLLLSVLLELVFIHGDEGGLLSVSSLDDVSSGSAA